MSETNKNEEWLLNDLNSWERNPLFKGQQTPPPLEEEFDGAMVSEDWDVL